MYVDAVDTRLDYYYLLYNNILLLCDNQLKISCFKNIEKDFLFSVFADIRIVLTKDGPAVRVPTTE